MTRLTVYADDQPEAILLDTTDLAEIVPALRAIKVGFERWPAAADLTGAPEDAAVLSAYAPQIAALKAEGGYAAVDVVRMRPDHPERRILREKFLSEHRHGEDEVRFFVEGAAVFYLRDEGKVHAVLCEKGDLIRVPAGIRHWFDMGPSPSFAAIRLFVNPAGWVAKYTGDPIADAYPRYEAEAA